MTWDEWKQKGIPGRLEAALRGENPTVIARMPSGFAVLGDTQFLPGYCVLLAHPIVASIDDLPLDERTVFLRDMTLLGRALLEACGAERMNYGIYGNHDPYLHAHVWARYSWEDEARKKGPAWFYPAEERAAPEVMFDSNKHQSLQKKIAKHLHSLLQEHGLS
jgi:diadenosine tetraphosphate (Ap4A) HIT family hydrolase